MKTRTLLLLSVGVGLMILLAGGVLLFQLSNEQAAVEPAAPGERVVVGDVDVTVTAFELSGDGIATVAVDIGGVDDADGIDSFRLITGDRRLEPISAPAAGRCAAITEAVASCAISFDLSGVDASNRVLVLRRGDEQRNWVLETP